MAVGTGDHFRYGELPRLALGVANGGGDHFRYGELPRGLSVAAAASSSTPASATGDHFMYGELPRLSIGVYSGGGDHVRYGEEWPLTNVTSGAVDPGEADVVIAAGVAVGATAAIVGGVTISAGVAVGSGLVLTGIELSAGVAVGSTLTLDADALVVAEPGVAVGASLAVVTNQIVTIRAGVTVGSVIGRLGRGYGIIVGPDTFGNPALTDIRDIIKHLREGDRQQVILPWAGVSGRSGLARILSRSTKDQESLQQFGNVDYEDVPDPEVIRKAGRGAARRHTPSTRGSVSRTIRKQGREIERLKRDQN